MSADGARAALVDVFRHEIKDLDLGLLTITGVEVSPDMHFARVPVVKAIDAAKQGAFASAAGTDESDSFPRRHGQRDAVKHRPVAKAFGDVRECDLHPSRLLYPASDLLQRFSR